ncbi:uncharacterized protein LOC127531900 [Acanthochromis polyacanthus]|uniref:uncharacterized protein LOC127531900 n=1 Tax=Acanthochromis polyacanthus TaxID=80966 RepID=UPI0022340B64|nr:uncharacterized protein LOC127531900 [Acanthochromis polyacanthus]
MSGPPPPPSLLTSKSLFPIPLLLSFSSSLVPPPSPSHGWLHSDSQPPHRVWAAVDRSGDYTPRYKETGSATNRHWIVNSTIPVIQLPGPLSLPISPLVCPLGLPPGCLPRPTGLPGPLDLPVGPSDLRTCCLPSQTSRTSRPLGPLDLQPAVPDLPGPQTFGSAACRPGPPGPSDLWICRLPSRTSRALGPSDQPAAFPDPRTFGPACRLSGPSDLRTSLPPSRTLGPSDQPAALPGPRTAGPSRCLPGPLDTRTPGPPDPLRLPAISAPRNLRAWPSAGNTPAGGFRLPRMLTVGAPAST